MHIQQRSARKVSRSEKNEKEMQQQQQNLKMK